VLSGWGTRLRVQSSVAQQNVSNTQPMRVTHPLNINQTQAYDALLELGADPTIKDSDGQVAAEAADW